MYLININGNFGIVRYNGDWFIEEITDNDVKNRKWCNPYIPLDCQWTWNVAKHLIKEERYKNYILVPAA